MKRAFVVADLGFGDAGKGTVTDFLTAYHKGTLVVRYGGGPQCAHNVITADGRHHTFSQFGAGTFSGARTFLSRFMLIEPFALVNEADAIESKGVTDPLRLVSVDPLCTIITPYHRLANQLREIARGRDSQDSQDGRHGSTGLGLGEARSDELSGLVLIPDDCKHLGSATRKLRTIQDIKLAELAYTREFDIARYAQLESIDPGKLALEYRDVFQSVEVERWEDARRGHDTVTFEGHQGVLLDEKFGFAPYHTWTDCTFGNADALLLECGLGVDISRIGVLRSYHTRHGAGPFPTEDSRLIDLAPEVHNQRHEFMGEFRVGHFDAVLGRYAIKCCGNLVDSIFLTHLDQRPSDLVCVRYEGWDWGMPRNTSEMFGAKPVYERYSDITRAVEEQTGVQVSFTSCGPRAVDKRVRIGSESVGACG